MRNYKLDNMKCALIFLVVLGHLCAVVPFKFGGVLYNMIYLFHMPAFVFTTGVFASSSVKRISRKLAYPYLIFQTLYLLFARYWLGTEETFSYTMPYWIMWYLLACMVWMLLLPFFETDSIKRRAVNMAAVTAAALLAGYDKYAGYVGSLSRILVYMPFFLAGYYFRHSGLYEAVCAPGEREKRLLRWIRPALCAAALGCLVLVFLLGDKINAVWFYNAGPYSAAASRMLYRILGLGAAAVITAAMLLMSPGVKIPVLTSAGQHTMTVYMLHGFIVKAVQKTGVLAGLPHRGFITLGAALIITLALSEKHAAKLFSPLMAWPFEKRDRESGPAGK